MAEGREAEVVVGLRASARPERPGCLCVVATHRFFPSSIACESCAREEEIQPLFYSSTVVETKVKFDMVRAGQRGGAVTPSQTVADT